MSFGAAGHHSVAKGKPQEISPNINRCNWKDTLHQLQILIWLTDISSRIQPCQEISNRILPLFEDRVEGDDPALLGENPVTALHDAHHLRIVKMVQEADQQNQIELVFCCSKKASGIAAPEVEVGELLNGRCDVIGIDVNALVTSSVEIWA